MKKLSNNPKGRTPIPKMEKKELVGVYLKRAEIAKHGGKKKLRAKIIDLLGAALD